MRIEKEQIKVRDLVNGYDTNEETGRVVAYGGRLDVRPPYQRNYCYRDKQRDEVIRTIKKGFPLNVMYWAKTGDGTFEVLDGQQRTISICEYVAGNYSVDFRFFHNLTQEEKDTILDYELDVYKCEGTALEKLEWFRIINIVGEKLTEQELRNINYTGAWLSDAKKRFSANNCAAYRLAKEYMSGTPIRQDYLETVLTWIAHRDGCTIEEYMGRHQNDANADELWNYFRTVLEWVEMIFTTYRKEMKGIEWGILYNNYGSQPVPNATIVEQRVKALMEDEDVTCKKGVYTYIFSGEEKVLSVRAFTPSMKREAYERQNHKCPHCTADGVDRTWEFEEMEGDHITPWHSGGKTNALNCQMLCKAHNRTKSGT